MGFQWTNGDGAKLCRVDGKLQVVPFSNFPRKATAGSLKNMKTKVKKFLLHCLNHLMYALTHDGKAFMEVYRDIEGL